MNRHERLGRRYQLVPCGSRRARQRVPVPRLLYFILGIVLLSGCATSAYHGTDPGSASFLQRAQTQVRGSVTVRAAVPDAAETLALTGLDLYAQGIQPVWLEVENKGEHLARLSIWSIDRDYFSPIEVAYMNRGKFSTQGYRDMERWFYNNGLRRRVPAGESRSGLVFTNFRPGTKGFNLDIFSNRQSASFTFFVPIPGFEPDYAQVDFQSLYAADEYRELDQASLKTVLEDMPCCSTDETGQLNGGPFNLVLVGSPLAVRRSLLRGGWLETSVESEDTLAGRRNHFHGRPPDTIFHMDRYDGNERLQLNLWLAPWRVGSDNVWLAQVFYRYRDRPIAVALRKSGYLEDSAIISRLIGESISADIDSAQRFIMQNFWYNHSLLKIGLVSGAGVATLEDPGVTFQGFLYFTEGQRAVLFLSEAPVALDDARVIYTGDPGADGGSSNE
jgi:hypothetical protein